jgi:WD40 repeat protein
VIFNYPDLVPIKELLGHKGTISNLQMVSHQYLVSTGLDNTIICWDLNDYRGVLSMDIHRSPILSLCYDEESECIFTGSLDSTIIVSGLEFNDGELVDCKVLRKINVSGPVLNLSSVGAEKLISFENSKLRIYDSRGVLYRDVDTKCLPKTHQMINPDKGLIVDVSG